jgi:hypothetical protein
MLAVGRDERRRADAEAAAARARLDDDAIARRASLLAELEQLAQRRTRLLAELDEAAHARPAAPEGRPHLRALLERMQAQLAALTTASRH